MTLTIFEPFSENEGEKRAEFGFYAHFKTGVRQTADKIIVFCGMSFFVFISTEISCCESRTVKSMDQNNYNVSVIVNIRIHMYPINYHLNALCVDRKIRLTPFKIGITLEFSGNCSIRFLETIRLISRLISHYC